MAAEAIGKNTATNNNKQANKNSLTARARGIR